MCGCIGIRNDCYHLRSKALTYACLCFLSDHHVGAGKDGSVRWQQENPDCLGDLPHVHNRHCGSSIAVRKRAVYLSLSVDWFPSEYQKRKQVKWYLIQLGMNGIKNRLSASKTRIRLVILLSSGDRKALAKMERTVLMRETCVDLDLRAELFSGPARHPVDSRTSITSSEQTAVANHVSRLLRPQLCQSVSYCIESVDEVF